MAASMMEPNGRKILIVEDNELNMKLFNDLLAAHGYETLKTRDGREVMDIMRAERPDLVLMDIQLPEISGLEVTRMIKADEELQATPVVAVTAFAMKGDEEKIREGGCEGYISKPISVMGFLETVNGFFTAEKQDDTSDTDHPVETHAAESGQPAEKEEYCPRVFLLLTTSCPM